MEPYRIHPILVHFPIALILVAAFFEWAMPVAARRHAERWQWAAACMLWAATVVSAGTIATGLWAESTVVALPSAYGTIEWHERLGIATGILALILSVWRFLRPPPGIPKPWILYVLLWAVLVSVVGLTGYYGGQLVYDFGMGVEIE